MFPPGLLGQRGRSSTVPLPSVRARRAVTPSTGVPALTWTRTKVGRPATRTTESPRSWIPCVTSIPVIWMFTVEPVQALWSTPTFACEASPVTTSSAPSWSRSSSATEIGFGVGAATGVPIWKPPFPSPGRGST